MVVKRLERVSLEKKQFDIIGAGSAASELALALVFSAHSYHCTCRRTT